MLQKNPDVRARGRPKGSRKWSTDRLIALALGEFDYPYRDELNAPGDPLHRCSLRPDSLRKRFAEARHWRRALGVDAASEDHPIRYLKESEITPAQWAELRRIVIALRRIWVLPRPSSLGPVHWVAVLMSRADPKVQERMALQREAEAAFRALAALPGPRLDMTRRRLRIKLGRALSPLA
jgi:hypothetical protein